MTNQIIDSGNYKIRKWKLNGSSKIRPSFVEISPNSQQNEN